MDADGYLSEAVGPSEHERSAVVDRDRARHIAKDALHILLDITFHTPGDKELDLERLFGEFKTAVLPSLREYRARQKQRCAQTAAASGLLR
jgi:hypothetical protein